MSKNSTASEASRSQEGLLSVDSPWLCWNNLSFLSHKVIWSLLCEAQSLKDHGRYQVLLVREGFRFFREKYETMVISTKMPIQEVCSGRPLGAGNGAGRAKLTLEGETVPYALWPRLGWLMMW